MERRMEQITGSWEIPGEQVGEKVDTSELPEILATYVELLPGQVIQILHDNSVIKPNVLLLSVIFSKSILEIFMTVG